MHLQKLSAALVKAERARILRKVSLQINAIVTIDTTLQIASITTTVGHAYWQRLNLTMTLTMTFHFSSVNIVYNNDHLHNHHINNNKSYVIYNHHNNEDYRVHHDVPRRNCVE